MRELKRKGLDFMTSMKIKNKILMLSLIILLVPCILFAFISTEYYQVIQTENKKQTIENELEDAQSQFNNTLEICNITMQSMILNGKVEKFIDLLVEEENLSVHELIDFNHTEIRAVERLVNTNPYIHSIRFYIDAPILELAPAIYRIERFNKGIPVYHTEVSAWYFNQIDTISPIEKVAPYPKQLATLVTPYMNMKGKAIGVIEIATPMKLLFPQMYETTDEKVMYFLDHENKVYHGGETDEKKWGSYSNEITKQIKGESGIKVMEIGEEPIIVGYRQLKGLDGYLVIIHSLEKMESEIANLRLFVTVILVVLVTIITCLINISTKLVFRNFYKVLNAIQEIQKGNLDIDLRDFGKGEIGELGRNVQKLSVDIKELMADRVSKEILAKDSQIKALQNQINATLFITY